jgi:putative PIN family toxin of toxin-antitoxin system
MCKITWWQSSNTHTKKRRRHVNLLESQMMSVEPQKLDKVVCRDPDDDLVIGTAVAGGATFIITGDKDLLVLHEAFGVKIVSPNEFISLDADFPG